MVGSSSTISIVSIIMLFGTNWQFYSKCTSLFKFAFNAYRAVVGTYNVFYYTKPKSATLGSTGKRLVNLVESAKDRSGGPLGHADTIIANGKTDRLA